MAVAFNIMCVFLFCFFSPITPQDDVHIILLFTLSLIAIIIGLVLLISTRNKLFIFRTLVFSLIPYVFILGFFYISIGGLLSHNDYKFTLFKFTITGCRGYDFHDANIFFNEGYLYSKTMPYLMLILWILFIVAEVFVYRKEKLFNFIASIILICLGILILLTPVFASNYMNLEAIAEVEALNDVTLLKKYQITVAGYLYSFSFIIIGIAYFIIIYLVDKKMKNNNKSIA